jgi:hypothetical protein
MEFLRSDGLKKNQAPAQSQAAVRGGGVAGSGQKPGADSSRLVQQCATSGGESLKSCIATTASKWGAIGQTWHAQEDADAALAAGGE